MISCRPVVKTDASVWRDLRQALWPDAVPGEHAEAISRYFEGTLKEPIMVLFAEDDDGRAVGLIELSLRAYAEGCDSDNVGYVEGWFVVPELRGRGVGRALMVAAEDWARGEGCTEFASDAQLDDAASAAAHGAVGFAEVGQIRCFRKVL